MILIFLMSRVALPTCSSASERKWEEAEGWKTDEHGERTAGTWRSYLHPCFDPPLGWYATTTRVRPFSGLVWAT